MSSIPEQNQNALNAFVQYTQGCEEAAKSGKPPPPRVLLKLEKGVLRAVTDPGCSIKKLGYWCDLLFHRSDYKLKTIVGYINSNNVALTPDATRALQSKVIKKGLVDVDAFLKSLNDPHNPVDEECEEAAKIAFTEAMKKGVEDPVKEFERSLRGSGMFRQNEELVKSIVAKFRAAILGGVSIRPSPPAPTPAPAPAPTPAPTPAPAKATSQEKQLSEIAKRDHFVHFYDKKNPLTECFGNFYRQDITFGGRTFKCSESAFQAQKFTHRPDIMNKFHTVDGDGAFRLARDNKGVERTDWFSDNQRVMLEVLRTKFSDPHLKKLLLATGDAYLVEHIPVKGRDKFWGDDKDGTGQNMLGKFLMQVRGELGGTGVVHRPPQYDNFLAKG